MKAGYKRRTMMHLGTRSLRGGIRNVSAGLLVAFFGADGSGKSTVIERVSSELRCRLHDVVPLHFRPSVGRAAATGPVLDPHGQEPRSVAGSVAKLAYYIADFGLGYWLKLALRRRRGSIFLFDRYYHDLMVDPLRYRYGAPMVLARAARHLVPRPDLMILLDAPAEVLQQRKQEVSVEESARVRSSYLDLFDEMSDSHVVDCARPLNEVVEDVMFLILEYGGASRRAAAVPEPSQGPRDVHGADAPLKSGSVA